MCFIINKKRPLKKQKLKITKLSELLKLNRNFNFYIKQKCRPRSKINKHEFIKKVYKDQTQTHKT